MSIDLLLAEIGFTPNGTSMRNIGLSAFKSPGKFINDGRRTQSTGCKENTREYQDSIKIRSIRLIRVQNQDVVALGADKVFAFFHKSLSLRHYPWKENLMLKIVEHPIIQHYLALLRERETTVVEFRRALGKIALFLYYEAARNLPVARIEVATPLEKIEATVIAGKIHLIGILRAALGMIEGIVDHVPNVDVGHIGIYRDEETLAPQRYYSRLPKFGSGEPVFIIDPMLATGGSMVTAIDIVKKAGAANIVALTLIAAPEGVDYVSRHHPHLTMYTAALDRELNEQGYILPGLGDAGDRQFGTS